MKYQTKVIQIDAFQLKLEGYFTISDTVDTRADVGDWLVQYEDGSIEVVSNEYFWKKFSPAKETPTLPNLSPEYYEKQVWDWPNQPHRGIL